MKRIILHEWLRTHRSTYMKKNKWMNGNQKKKKKIRNDHQCRRIINICYYTISIKVRKKTIV